MGKEGKEQKERYECHSITNNFCRLVKEAQHCELDRLDINKNELWFYLNFYFSSFWGLKPVSVFHQRKSCLNRKNPPDERFYYCSRLDFCKV